jgi:threonine-phosphate decarboxylase
MTTRIHGGNINEAVKRYRLEGRTVIDFSSNVNPLGPSRAVTRAIRKSLSSIDRYPDPETPELRKAIARYFGIKPEQVICGNGSIAIIHLIPRVFRPKKVLIPAPTFTEYAAAVEDAGGEVVPFRLAEKDGFRVDPVEIAFALKGADMAFLCNPNNPTARLIPREEMMEIVKYALRENVRLVVDEAFMDFVETDSLIKEAVQSTHLICIRAFTKFFGLPGLRIGYAVSDERTIETLAAGREPWTVSVPAERAAVAALNDWGRIQKTRKLIAQERERLLSELRLLPGVEPFPSPANFIFVKLVSTDAPTLTESLGFRGILIRDCSSFPGLGNRFVRIAVRTRRENDRLVQALRSILIR